MKKHFEGLFYLRSRKHSRTAFKHVLDLIHVICAAKENISIGGAKPLLTLILSHEESDVIVHFKEFAPMLAK